MTALVVDNSMIDNALVKMLVAEYFKVKQADVIENQLQNYQKMLERKRQHAYNYYLKSKTDPEIKQKINEHRKQWYEKYKDRVKETRQERLKNDPDFREQINMKKREHYLIDSRYS